MRHSRGPDYSISRPKIHIFGHKLDTLCSSCADQKLAFRGLKSMFKVKYYTLCAPLTQTHFFLFTP